MTIQFTQNAQKDSSAYLLTRKAADNFASLEKEPRYNNLTKALFEELASSLDWLDSEGEANLNNAKELTGRFFQTFNPAMEANQKLTDCLFSEGEFSLIEKEIPAFLEYLKWIQTNCQEHLAKFKAVKDRGEDIKNSLRDNQDVKEHFNLKAAPSFEVELAVPSDLDEEELVSLSTTLQKLRAKQEKLKDLEAASEKLFSDLCEWMKAIENEEKPAQQPLLEQFQELRTKIQDVSREEINFAPNLLKKSFFCSKAAGRALEQIAELAKRYNAQIDETKERLEARYEDHSLDYELWKSYKLNGELLSPAELAKSINPDRRVLALLKTVSWLKDLPRAELESLKRVFTNLDSTEKNVFKRLAEESSTAEQFFEKLGRFYNERMQHIEKQNQLLEKEKRELQAELSRGAKKLTDLTAEKKKLNEQILSLSQQIADSQVKQKNTGSLEKELTEKKARVIQLEAEIQSLNRQGQELTQKLETTDAKLADVQQKSQNQIRTLETEKRELQAELGREVKKLKDLTAEKTKLEEHILSLGQQIADSQVKQKDTGSLEKELTEKKARVIQLEAEIQSLNRQDQELTQKLATTDAKLADVQQKSQNLIRDLEQKVKALETELSGANQETRNEIEDLRRKLTASRQKAKALKVEKEDLSKQVSEQNERMQAIQQQNQLLEKEKGCLKTHIHELKTQYEEKRSRMEKELENRISELTEQKRQAMTLSRNRRDLEEKILELESESFDAKSEIARLKKQLEEEEAADKAALEKRINELLDQISTNSTEHRNMLSTIETLQNDLKEKREIIVNSEKEKEDLKKEFLSLKNQFESELAQARKEGEIISYFARDPYFEAVLNPKIAQKQTSGLSPSARRWLGLIPGADLFF
ncbi:MAG: hypothetical protein ACK5MA_02675 [Parachlamydiaceae bacterium]